MCNHYRNTAEFIENWKEYISWNIPPAYIEHDQFAEDVYPKRQGLVIRETDGQKIAESMHWGFPWKGKGKRPGTTKKNNTTNIRNLSGRLVSNVLNKSENRCLVPFSEFAEPAPGKHPDTGRPNEHWFAVKEKKVSAFAGIWRKQKEGNCFAFLTCNPNPWFEKYHPKAMPVILHPEDYERWLSGEDAEEFQEPFPSQLMLAK
tara:strand:- start:6594 stop:7202 length:609 start_codon:yes stop_codon:yes gene_type:complete